MGIFDDSIALQQEKASDELLALRNWTPEEEQKVKRKLDFILLPLLVLGFFALQLDRGNISGALTDNFLVEVGITQNQFNIGQQLLSAGIVILEVPANLILWRLGPQRWLSIQITAWGLVSTFQAFIKGKGLGPYLATRLLLGLTEGGFIPAGLFVISQFYTVAETSKRFTFYFVGNLSAAATTGLISYGVLHMRGIAGLSGWQWLWILSGIFTVLVGVIFALFFPGSYDDPKPWFTNISYFSERELYILKWRVVIDQPNKAGKEKKISWAVVKRTLGNPRVLIHCLITLSGAAPAAALGAYAPTIVGSFGYDRLRANALAAVGGFMLVVLTPLSGLLSDKTGKRGLVVVGAIVLSWSALLMNVLVQPASTNREERYGAIIFAVGVLTLFHPINGAWLSINTRNPQERAVALAMFIMGANSSGIIGAQLFRQDDRPRYNRGFKVALGLVSFSLFLSIAQVVGYAVQSRRHAREEEARALQEGSGQSSLDDKDSALAA